MTETCHKFKKPNFSHPPNIAIMKTYTIFTLFTSALCFQSTNAFVDMAIPMPAAAPMITPEALIGDAISSFADSPLVSSTMGIANSMTLPAQAAASAISSSPEVESEFLGDMAHMALDFSGLFRPTKKTMRLYSLGGRLLGLMADYVPDHSIHAEELLIQVFFMGMTLKEILDDELRVAF